MEPTPNKSCRSPTQKNDNKNNDDNNDIYVLLLISLSLLISLLFKGVFYVVLVSPPPEGSGEGPDCHFPGEICGFGPIPARIRGKLTF